MTASSSENTGYPNLPAGVIDRHAYVCVLEMFVDREQWGSLQSADV
jgi:hypothetical protein